jgi:methylase of polypeptide subunit release factors
VEEPLLEVGSSVEAAVHRLALARSSGYWDVSDLPETKIHRIHSYPTKFPAFLTTKALSFARAEGLKVRRVADVFCGCGTVAYEARREGLEFWGCDINPVATLIARAKSGRYDPERLDAYACNIETSIQSASDEIEMPSAARTRLLFWYRDEQFRELSKLLNAIRSTVPARSPYLTAFLCAFSAILRSTSQWRARATKPAYDSHKVPAQVRQAFKKQCALMVAAWLEADIRGPKPEIHDANVMTIDVPRHPVDLIITSPPYVTSYEYADLHQLSSLWLGYASDHRQLRRGSIGSASHDLNFRSEFKRLNQVGTHVAFSIFGSDQAAARSVANYYLDMQWVARRCKEFLSPSGIAFFIIGNTEYGSVRVDNAAHLAESLFDAGFKRVRATKRTISNKMHTPFRDHLGRLSVARTGKDIYSEEFILIAER